LNETKNIRVFIITLIWELLFIYPNLFSKLKLNKDKNDDEENNIFTILSEFIFFGNIEEQICTVKGIFRILLFSSFGEFLEDIIIILCFRFLDTDTNIDYDNKISKLIFQFFNEYSLFENNRIHQEEISNSLIWFFVSNFQNFEKNPELKNVIHFLVNFIDKKFISKISESIKKNLKEENITIEEINSILIN